MPALTDASRATSDRLTRIGLPLREAEALAPAEQPQTGLIADPQGEPEAAGDAATEGA
jgi:hypothetical protein